MLSQWSCQNHKAGLLGCGWGWGGNKGSCRGPSSAQRHVLTSQTATGVPTGAPEKSRHLGSGSGSGTYSSRILDKWLLPGFFTSLGVTCLLPGTSVPWVINQMAVHAHEELLELPLVLEGGGTEAQVSRIHSTCCRFTDVS